MIIEIIKKKKKKKLAYKQFKAPWTGDGSLKLFFFFIV